MSTKQTVDDLYDRRYHNAPESGGLSMLELETIEAGRAALSSLHKTFDLWIAIGRAVVTLREKADRLQGRQTFKRLMAQQGFRMDGTPHEKVLDKGVVSKLEEIMKPENLTRVQAWYEQLPPKHKREWAAPTTVFKHCPVFAKPKDDGEPKLTPVQQRDQIIVKLEEENHRLKQQKEDERFTPTDTAEDVATCIVGMFTPSKAMDIARRILAKAKP